MASPAGSSTKVGQPSARIPVVVCEVMEAALGNRAALAFDTFEGHREIELPAGYLASPLGDEPARADSAERSLRLHADDSARTARQRALDAGRPRSAPSGNLHWHPSGSSAPRYRACRDRPARAAARCPGSSCGTGEPHPRRPGSKRSCPDPCDRASPAVRRHCDGTRKSPAHSSVRKPEPVSTANSHISSKSLRSNVDSTESGASGDSRSRAVTSNSALPAASRCARRNSASSPKRAIDQSLSVGTIVVCSRTLMATLSPRSMQRHAAVQPAAESRTIRLCGASQDVMLTRARQGFLRDVSGSLNGRAVASR